MLPADTGLADPRAYVRLAAIVYRSETRLSAVTWVFLRDRGVAGTISGCCCRSSTGC